MKRSNMAKEAFSVNAFYDVIIIGGGCTGAWLAVDSASRGFRTLLLEGNDFASHTSSRSTKLIHGGLRYLQYGDIRLVKEALKERNLLLHMAEDFIYPIEFLIPCFSSLERWKYKTGLMIYDFLAKNETRFRRGSYSKEKAREDIPNLCLDRAKDVLSYFDAGFDDSRFVIEIVKKAREYGATLLNYASVDRFIYNKNHEIIGVFVKDKKSLEEYEIYGKHFINATGPFTDLTRKMDRPYEKSIMCLSKGSHIVVDHCFLPGKKAVLIPKTKDGRIIFMIPWHGKTLIGTTDIEIKVLEKDPPVTDDEITMLLETVAPYLHKVPIQSDILSMFAGIRPLVQKIPTRSSKKISRSHQILLTKPGSLITITGGKWTTSRLMAKETLDKMMDFNFLPRKNSITHTFLFYQKPHFSKNFLSEGFTKEDVLYSLEEEMATCIEDIIARRYRILFLDAKKALEIAPKVGEILASFDPEHYNLAEDLESFKKTAKGYCSQSFSQAK